LLAAVPLLTLTLVGCGGDDGGEAEPPPAATTAETGATEPTGEALFTANCGGCHTLAAAGTTGAVGPNLDELMPAAARVEAQVRNGGGGMPAFEGRLSDDQIAAVADYVSSAAGA
jgi:mono/diheme cytochrome c family protein